jgi:hypothetical protein
MTARMASALCLPGVQISIRLSSTAQVIQIPSVRHRRLAVQQEDRVVVVVWDPVKATAFVVIRPFIVLAESLAAASATAGCATAGIDPAAFVANHAWKVSVEFQRGARMHLLDSQLQEVTVLRSTSVRGTVVYEVSELGGEFCCSVFPPPPHTHQKRFVF